VYPDDVLPVANGALRRKAANIAKAFPQAAVLIGIIMAKGYGEYGDCHTGIALSMKEVIRTPIPQIRIGEKIEAFEILNATRIAQWIFGMGDVLSLFEKLKKQMTKNKLKT
jgi:signal recognition particle subunit SRP54